VNAEKFCNYLFLESLQKIQAIAKPYNISGAYCQTYVEFDALNI